MFIIIYNNQTKYIAQVRCDDSTSAEKPTPQWWLEDYAKSNKQDIAQLAVATIPFDMNKTFVIRRDMYDAATNTVYADANWVATPNIETP